MKKLTLYRNPISLIPFGCPQLLDYESLLTSFENVRYSFEEIPHPEDKSKLQFHAYRRNEEKEFVDEIDPTLTYSGNGYAMSGLRELEPWMNVWLPLPFLRCREQTWPDSDDCRFERGPSNWARGFLALNPENQETLRLTIAFDMQVEEKNLDNYAALTQDDVDANAHFRLAWRLRDNAWFLNLPWVEEWLKEVWSAYRTKMKRKQQEDDPLFSHLASYLTLLEVIQIASNKCEVYVVRPDATPCVEVDLVLDIGNSRTTGLLVETQTQRKTDLNDSYLLQLRDMSNPNLLYSDPFDTRVEFSEIFFGNEALSLRSGRHTPAFSWSSPVRIGPEAGRLATRSRSGKGSTGMSSPKRYLWDEQDWKGSWRYNTGTEKSPYVTRGKLAQQVNSSGTPLCCMDDSRFLRNPQLNKQERESAFESYFTRSSLMMFLFVEIIQQALLTINSPAQRQRREPFDIPRRLRQIIFTVPAGMPMAEQRIYKRWAQWAVHALWEALGWGKYYLASVKKNLTQNVLEDYRLSPVIRCDWDEATCTQLVYIYNEITQQFQGDARLFCELAGKEREFGDHLAPSVRVATIDIGGGTTDLSITTFELASESGATQSMAPHPEFHDGFNLAGDDILRAVISEHVLAPVGEILKTAGFKDSRSSLASLFGRNVMDSSSETRNQRAQFIRQVAVPAGLCLLQLYEKSDLRKTNERISFKLRDCFEKEISAEKLNNETKAQYAFKQFPMPGASALNYINNFCQENGMNNDFDILDMTLTMDAKLLDDTIRAALNDILVNLCEVINLYDCDVLLLTGRPSRWPGIVNTIYSLAPLPADRIIPMGEYRVGTWYPFADALGNMTDPKTTVVVGAILCSLAEGQLQGFSFDSHELSLISTARFIGEMELNGQIIKDKVWFNVDPEAGTVEPEGKQVSFSGPIAVGFRQLAAERWTTTPFYILDYKDEASRQKVASKLPLKLNIKFLLPEDEDKESNRDEGEFEIDSEVKDRDGESINNPLIMRLQTLPMVEGFWMDTGIIL